MAYFFALVATVAHSTCCVSATLQAMHLASRRNLQLVPTTEETSGELSDDGRSAPLRVGRTRRMLSSVAIDSNGDVLDSSNAGTQLAVAAEPASRKGSVARTSEVVPVPAAPLDAMVQIQVSSNTTVTDNATNGTVLAVDASAHIGTLSRGGLSTSIINLYAVLGCSAIVAAVLCAHTIDAKHPGWAPAEGRPRVWVFALLTASYVFLLPGLTFTLFSWHLAGAKPLLLAESTASCVELLLRLGGYIGVPGALALLLFAVFVPIVKIALLVLGERWRFSEDPACIAAARRCVRFVQIVSKWASPSLFAQMLVLKMLRDLRDTSTLQVAAHLDVGFTCFALFCICSTLAALAIPLPAHKKDDGHVGESIMPWRDTHYRGILETMAIACLVFLYWGCSLPCITVRLDKELLEQQLNIPIVFASSLTPSTVDLQFGTGIRFSTSIFQVLQAFSEYVLAYWEINCALALILLASLVVVVPVINVLLLLVAARVLGGETSGFSLADKRRADPCALIELSRKLMHLEMLDVFTMGAIVAVLCGCVLWRHGVVIGLGRGAPILLVAEGRVERAKLRTLMPA
eukprot:TRINITY_DN8780_c0_g1_i1.p1 TRINITY_DN8780_c0_g1~~TRINITY_DN8780_c0_g1_i1.p1  ORF type:complete len:590 (+),score=95.14 TRINITY_DN8780_c0_g1_i1:50-1771(+)